MSFTNRFFDGSEEQEAFLPPQPEQKDQFENSFELVNDDDLAAHLQIAQYGHFELTDAVRPAFDLKIKPSQGYRHDVYVDEETGARVPVIMASASKEILFPLFMDLVQRLGTVVDVVLETSHDAEAGAHTDLYREHIDMPVLGSTLWDFEDLLTNDGCTGIAVLNPNTPQEIQFDEHKLLIIYGSPLEHFEFLLESRGVTCQPNMQFITEAEHIHSSTEDFKRRFNVLRTGLGLDGSSEPGCDQEGGYDQDFQGMA